MSTSSRTLKQIAYQQLKEFLLIALYLWVVFGLLIMYKSVILAKYHIDFAYHGFAIINALALAKVMLTAKDLHLGEQFDEAPLIYPTLLKSALFRLYWLASKSWRRPPSASITINPSSRVLPISAVAP